MLTVDYWLKSLDLRPTSLTFHFLHHLLALTTKSYRSVEIVNVMNDLYSGSHLKSWIHSKHSILCLKRRICHNWQLNYLLHQFLWPFQVWHKHSTNIAGRKQRKSEWIVRLREVSDFWGSSCFLKDSKWHWIVGCRCFNATFPLVVMMWYNCHSQIDRTSSILYLYLASCRKQTFLWYQTDIIDTQKLFYTWMKPLTWLTIKLLSLLITICFFAFPWYGAILYYARPL